MPSRDELLAREASAWEAFDRAVGRVARQDRERPDALEGWSVKDLVWHCAYWADFCAGALERAGEGPFVDPFDGQDDEVWDAENAQVAKASSVMTWDQVAEGAAAARARVRAAAGLTTDEATAGFFGDETFVHYDEHTAHVEAFANRVASS
jgi:uncharacterized protein (TIGR03083 family)